LTSRKDFNSLKNVVIATLIIFRRIDPMDRLSRIYAQSLMAQALSVLTLVDCKKSIQPLFFSPLTALSWR